MAMTFAKWFSTTPAGAEETFMEKGRSKLRT